MLKFCGNDKQSDLQYLSISIFPYKVCCVWTHEDIAKFSYQGSVSNF
jgi:hypothetical protein